MQLMTLNIWGGYIRNPLLKFISQHQKTEIFCFQEVYHNAPDKISTDDKEVSLDIFAQLQSLLPNHHGFFRPVVEDIYGICTFIKHDLDVLSEGSILIHDNPDYKGRGPTHARNLQWIECAINNQTVSIFNVHGLWNGHGKTDTPARISQSLRIKKFMDTIHTPKILCGDLNLMPETQSIKILERGMTNLITTYGISSTRSSLYPKQERFADYILTSPEINVTNFRVLQDEVSDHLPLVLDFTI